MASGKKRAAEDEVCDGAKILKENNMKDGSLDTIKLSGDYDLSSLDGILAFLSNPFSDIVGTGFMKAFVIMRLLYAARVNGADLFHSNEVDISSFHPYFYFRCCCFIVILTIFDSSFEGRIPDSRTVRSLGC